MSLVIVTTNQTLAQLVVTLIVQQTKTIEGLIDGSYYAIRLLNVRHGM